MKKQSDDDSMRWWVLPQALHTTKEIVLPIDCNMPFGFLPMVQLKEKSLMPNGPNMDHVQIGS